LPHRGEILLAEIERFLLTASGVTHDSDTPSAGGTQFDTASSLPLPPGDGGGEGEGVSAEGAQNHDKPRSHDTSRIVRAKPMAQLGEEFLPKCPACGGDIHRRVHGRQEPAHFEREVRQ
jgi:hypothetical protein